MGAPITAERPPVPVKSGEQLIVSQSSDNGTGDVTAYVQEPLVFKHSWSVWCIFVFLCLFSFLSALDGTTITTSLPTITREIGGGSDQLYLWIAQCFLFASTVPQPLFGQIADVFGRRNPFLVAIALFALGSSLSGAASNPAMLIAGRTTQGLGAAGLYVLSDIIICDLVPPRHRGPYLSAVLSTAGLGSTIGPIVGGALAQVNWRWIFYLNVPIAVVGFFVVLLFYRVKHNRSPTLDALKRVDFLGALIFIPSMISLFLALITGGVQRPWSSWRVLLPLLLGICGWILYHVLQANPSLPSSTPPRLFTNRTSAAGFLYIFLGSIILQSIAYFLPLYFQAVKLAKPMLSGVYYLPFALAIIPFAGGTGVLLSRYGRYIPFHYGGFALAAAGAGALSLLTATSSHAAWIGFQIVASAGVALIFTPTLPSTLAPLKDADVAVATATYSFVRSLGFVWGVTMAGVVFNGRVDACLHLVVDEGVRARLQHGLAYAFAATGDGVRALEGASRAQAVEVYVRALRSVWLVTMAVALLGFVCVPLEKHIELRKSHETEFGLEESGGREPESGGDTQTARDTDRKEEVK